VSTAQDHTHFTGHDVVSTRGEKIGKAADVLFDEEVNRPAWIRVDQGPFHSRHTLVPLQGAYERDGQVVVPFDKDTVKNAPKVSLPVVLAGEVKSTFQGYYNVQDSAEAADELPPQLESELPPEA